MHAGMADSVCWFCGQNPPDARVSISVTLSATTAMRSVQFGTEFERSSVTIPIPRCRACSVAHERKEERCVKAGCLGGLLAFLLAVAVALVSRKGSWRTILAGAGVAFIYFWLFYCFAKIFMRPAKGVKQARYARKHPEVLSYKKRNWGISNIADPVAKSAFY